MNTKTIFSIIIVAVVSMNGQSQEANDIVENNYSSAFKKAYVACPTIPKGVLEAVAYTNTHFENVIPDADVQGCIERPSTYGIMGLIADGKNYFNNNLVFVANLSHMTADEIAQNPEKQLLAYALAYTAIKEQLHITSNSIEAQVPILVELSELPNSEDLATNFALQAHIYSVLSFLNNKTYQGLNSFPDYKIDLKQFFGVDNYNVLSSSYVSMSETDVTSQDGSHYNVSKINTSSNGSANSTTSIDYSSAIWNQAAACNFSNRTGAITSIAIHMTQGSYASTLSWFKNCASKVSAHYVVRSSDGQITQMVLESKKAWHIGINNGFTIGIEHEGFISNPDWFTNNMYASSAKLVKDICVSGYGILKTSCYSGPSCSGGSSVCGLSNFYKIKGHQHFVGQAHTDPGKFWNWSSYYNRINSTISSSTFKQGSLFQTAVYPNPALSQVEISFENKNHTETAVIEILSFDGQVLLNKEVQASTNTTETLNIEQLKAGLYLMKIKNGENVEYKRLQVGTN